MEISELPHNILLNIAFRILFFILITQICLLCMLEHMKTLKLSLMLQIMIDVIFSYESLIQLEIKKNLISFLNVSFFLG